MARLVASLGGNTALLRETIAGLTKN